MDAKKDKSRESVFLGCRIVGIFLGLYHVNKYFFPAGEDSLQQLVFVGISAISVYGLWKRPRWFIYFFAFLMLQQFYSYGGSAIKKWQIKHTVDWVSIAILLLMPIIFIILLKDKKHASKRPANS